MVDGNAASELYSVSLSKSEFVFAGSFDVGLLDADLSVDRLSAIFSCGLPVMQW